MNIVLLGIGGSGKDTLADGLKDDFLILSPGQLYRSELEAKTEFGLEAHSYWGNGNLCPDDMTNKLMCLTLSKYTDDRNIIFNGYPRTKNQAEYLDTITNIDIVLNLTIPEDEVIRRLLKRGRSGETEEVIRQIILVYNSNCHEIENYYASKLHTISTLYPANEVLLSVKKIMGL